VALSCEEPIGFYGGPFSVALSDDGSRIAGISAGLEVSERHASDTHRETRPTPQDRQPGSAPRSPADFGSWRDAPGVPDRVDESLDALVQDRAKRRRLKIDRTEVDARRDGRRVF
jgi:hypothetical protein